MPIQRYAVNQIPVGTLLTWIKTQEIAIPEIQRPFIWSNSKVRDFIDSLYQGYPVGYLIAWRNPDVRLKDGTQSTGKRILIDGQQRVMALLAALLGQWIIGKDYRKRRITIAFHPEEERFEVANAAIRKARGWLADVSTVFAPDTKIRQLVESYCEANEELDKDDIYDRMDHLRGILNNSLGIIELNADLDVETVTEVFVRINSQGVQLNAADFAMSKLAAGEYNGPELRKCIDYFCHLASVPEAFDELARDQQFFATPYFQAMEWLKNERDDLYDPSYTDMLRVTFALKFRRGRLENLIALLSGRDFTTRSFDQAVIEKSFAELEDGIFQFMNETNFKRFVMILRSAGFTASSLIRSQNTVNFAYVLFLELRSQRMPPEQIESLVRRWYVMSVLTGRYTASPEVAFGQDIANIHRQGAAPYLDNIQRADLSDTFWQVGLRGQMDTAVASSPYFNVFLASQVRQNNKGFLSRDLAVRDLLEGQGHIHHVFPRRYLQKHGFPRSRYNQIANYVMMQSEINIAIGNLPPCKYFAEMVTQCQTGVTRYGGIADMAQLQENLADHCIPSGMDTVDIEDYDEFLQHRRELMAAKIRDYYWSL